MIKDSKGIAYKTYCFSNGSGDIMFFLYNSNHPIMIKGVKFELGKVKIFASTGLVYHCTITSTPHLNIYLDWNEEYFAKLFHGLAEFQLQGNHQDEDDSTVSLVVRDRFQTQEEVFLMRAKLTEQFGINVTDQLWNTFARFNQEKINSLQSMFKENQELKAKSDVELMNLIRLQEAKEEEKRKLKGQVSALLREKQAKLMEFQREAFSYGFDREMDPSSVELTEQKDSLSMAGSLFQESQQFVFHN